MKKQFIFPLVVLAITLKSCVSNPLSKSNSIEFLILHNNDMHARFEQTSVSGGKCSQEAENTNKCYGGFSRTAHEIRKFRKEAKSGGLEVLYLNAGDTYTGTPWFTIFKDNITTTFLNKLSPDAISLGNHEFDEGVSGLIPFLYKAKFPILAANLDLSKEPEMLKAKMLMKSTILEVSGVKVGVIGYVTPETKFLTLNNNVEFKDEIKSINEEAANLKSQGIKIIIALGHSGYQKDQEIAAKCHEVDIVIGGHTNTFLYNGNQPDYERPEGPYPQVVTQSSGKKVPVVQAYAYTKYLGKLHVQFDKNGDLLKFDGQPILLNAEIPRDSDILDLLNLYRPNITALENDIIGYTKVRLEGRASVCRVAECNLGNLIADSMVYARTIQDEGGKFWSDAAIGFVQGGGIRSSIEKRSDGSITENDVLTALPFKNDVYMTKVSGSTIRNALEHSAEVFDKDSNGGFLQVSGIRVVYNISNPIGKRVQSVEVLCSECEVPSYSDLDDGKMYNIIISKFLLDGGDGHKLNENNGSNQRLPFVDSKTLSEYVKARKIIYPGIEGRITWVGHNSGFSLKGSLFTIMLAFVLRQLIN
ncbi:protein 5NUC-like [Eupeodes corollae]|uniref:protein 5NUC-like n=1 Tax=Eupeodes corollae TaxID=290404 RepID=UPI002491CE1E|nr:protein 5NUC-like [Eupeodes corollae]